MENTEYSDPRIDRIDYQKRSVWLRNGQRLGFAQARKLLAMDI